MRDHPAIRLLGPEDVDAFRSIRLEALRKAPESFCSSLEEWQDLPDTEWRRRLVENSVFVAEDGPMPVGIMALARQRARSMAHRATIQMVYVSSASRGRGIAEALLEALVAFARERGVLQLELQVRAENDGAIRLYRRQGFAEIGRIPAGVIYEGREIDEIMMAIRIVDREN